MNLFTFTIFFIIFIIGVHFVFVIIQKIPYMSKIKRAAYLAYGVTCIIWVYNVYGTHGAKILKHFVWLNVLIVFLAALYFFHFAFVNNNEKTSPKHRNTKGK